MAKVKYHTIEDIIKAFEDGSMNYNSIDSLSVYYKNKGNEERSQMYKDALKQIRKIIKATKKEG